MNKLEYGLKQIADRNRDGSFSTQANRRKILSMCAEQLKDLGYKTKQMNPSDFKGRHVNALLRQWRNDGVSVGTIKNRMAVLRWWAEKVGKSDMIKDNKTYGIENRQYVTNADKSQDLKNVNVDAIKSPYIKQSLALQASFGLRREESMKFNPAYALEGKPPAIGGVVKIKPSWSKGGRYREITITNENQVKALNDAINLVNGDGSMIPPDKSYKEHLGQFERQTASIGLGQTHGLRHKYAQDRYRELTGFDCPIVGGVRELDDEDKLFDEMARRTISSELGHNRIVITGVYLGSWNK